MRTMRYGYRSRPGRPNWDWREAKAYKAKMNRRM